MPVAICVRRPIERLKDQLLFVGRNSYSFVLDIDFEFNFAIITDRS